MLKRWRRGLEQTCRTCKIQLNDFVPVVRPYGYSICSIIMSYVYQWVPKFMTLRLKYQQDLLTYLTQGNFKQAFKVCFILGIEPTSLHDILGPDFRESFEKMYFSTTCSMCSNALVMDITFVANCAHFYCTTCAAYLMYGKGDLGVFDVSCNKCGKELPNTPNEYPFIRPVRSLEQVNQISPPATRPHPPPILHPPRWSSG